MQISTVYEQFDAEVNFSVVYMALPANVTRLKLEPDQVSSMQGHLEVWNTRFRAYKDPSTHTAQTVIDMKEIYDDFFPEIQGIKQQLKNNKAIHLTGEDISKINIHVDAERRHRVPCPTDTPCSEVLSRKHLVAKILTHSSDPEHSSERRLPDDVDKIGRKMVVQANTDPIPTDDKYIRIESVGTAVYDIVFEQGNEGKRAYLKTCYISPTGEEGPFGEHASFIII